MPLPLIQDQDQDHWNNDAGNYLPSTTWDASVAAMNLAASKTSIGLAGDYLLKNKFDKVEGQKILSIPELNEKYMGSGITWTSPQKEITAQVIARAHEQEQMWSNRATMGQGLTGEALNVGAGLLAGMGDPAMAAGGSVLGMAMKSAKFLPTLIQSETLAGRFARGAVEGGAISAAMEPLGIARDAAYQKDHSFTESVGNVLMGMGMGAAFEGLKFGAKKFADNFLLRGTPAEDGFRLSEAAAASMSEGKRPMLEPILDHAAKERSAEGVVFDKYEYHPVDTEQPVSKRYFLGAQGGSERLADAAPYTRGAASTNFGDGLYGSDRLASENGMAASDFNAEPGLIHQFETQGARLFDTEKPLDQNTAAMLASQIEPFDKQVAKDLREGDVSLKQAYEQMHPEAKQAVNQALSQAGFDGLHFQDGPPSEPRNGVMMFPDKAENVKASEPYQADRSVKGGLTPPEAQEALKNYAAKQNDLFHSDSDEAVHAADNKRVEEGAGDTEDQKYLDDEHKRAAEFIKIVEEKGMLSKADQALAQEILKGSNEGEGPSIKENKALGEKLLKAMANCIVEH